MKELITLKTTDNGTKTVSGKELHEFLGIKRHLTQWLEPYTKDNNDYGFIENVDFEKAFNGINPTNNVPITDYMVSIEMAKQLCVIRRNTNKGLEMLKYLNKVSGDKEILIRTLPRKEIRFGEMLDKITGIEWLKQYPIDKGKYKLDFYLPYVLIIEYDEERHKYNYLEDEIRILYCREWLENNEGEGSEWRCPVIRVKEGEELEGINRIIRHLAGFDIFDTQNNYELQVCNYGNR